MASERAVLFDNVDSSSESANISRSVAILAQSLSDTKGIEYSARASLGTAIAAIRTRIARVYAFIIILWFGFGVDRTAICRILEFRHRVLPTLNTLNKIRYGGHLPQYKFYLVSKEFVYYYFYIGRLSDNVLAE